MKLASEEKTLIIIDTCSMKTSNYWDYKLAGDLPSIIGYIKDKNLHSKVKIGIPGMVEKEILKSCIDNYHAEKNCLNEKLRHLQKFSKKIDLELRNDSENISAITKGFDKAMAKQYFEKIDIPDKEYNLVFKDIVETAIKKEPPFTKQAFGFKDAVILESIKRSKNIKNFDNIIMFTKNREDFQKPLKNLSNNLSIPIELIPTYEEIEKHLEEKYFKGDYNIYRYAMSPGLLENITLFVEEHLPPGGGVGTKKKYKYSFALQNIRENPTNAEREYLTNEYSLIINSDEYLSFFESTFFVDYEITDILGNYPDYKATITLAIDPNEKNYTILLV